ncbi:SIS domain-containing protein [soil metagenome]
MAFDDSALDDPAALAVADPVLRYLAESGARVRRETDSMRAAATTLGETGGVVDRPRAMIVAGADSRLLRAVLEPWCPVPFVAWPGPGLPGWAGALDTVVVLAPASGDAAATSAVLEAVRRGCTLVLACPVHASLAEPAASRSTTLLPTASTDTLAVAVGVLQALHSVGLGPEVDAEQVATALDDVAVECSPFVDMGANPGKELAIVLADTIPLVWGGSVLAARAARRIAEALRRASGRASLAADVDHLLPVLAAATPHDLFADPFSDADVVAQRPALVLLDDASDGPVVREQRGRLVAAARANGVRVHRLAGTDGPPIARYGALLATGSYAAAYLAVGLGTAARLVGDAG